MADTGLMDGRVAVVHGRVFPTTAPAPEAAEAISGVEWLNRAEMIRAVRVSAIHDALTLAALQIASVIGLQQG